VKFDDLLARADDQTLQTLLGGAGMRLITLLDPKLATPTKLKEVILDLHGRSGLLLSRESRKLLLDILRPSEIQKLAALLKVSENDLYTALKNLRISRNSEREQILFDFFELPIPARDEHMALPVTESAEVGYPLFEHQRRATLEVQKKLYDKTRRVVLHMPTGSGKTRTAMNIIAEHFRSNEPTLVIWLASSEELCEQSASEFSRAWNYLGNRDLTLYRFWGDREINPQEIQDGLLVAGLAKLFSSTKQSLQFISILGSRCSLVVIDEAHIAVADTYRLMLDALVVQHPTTSLLGLTATPGRTWADLEADRKLSGFFSRQKVELRISGYDNPIDYLVDQGYLAKTNFRPLLHEGGFELSDDDLKRIESDLEIPEMILRRLAEDEQRNLVIIREVETLTIRHQRILVFATTVSHAQLLATVLSARGFRASVVTGNTNTYERARLIEEFKGNDPRPIVICNYGVLTTGFDAPKTSAAVIARPTKSLVLYSQMVGRAIRGKRAGGNDTAEIVTVVDQGLPGFNSIADAFKNWEDVWE